MPRRQTSLARQWFVLSGPPSPQARATLGRLPRGTGILIIDGTADAKLRTLARLKGLPLLHEHATAAVRVHNVGELRRALLQQTPLILLSPIFATASHPDWTPLPRMRAAALARLAGRRLVALGGMDERKFRRVQRLGFQGWAGISAFRT